MSPFQKLTFLVVFVASLTILASSRELPPPALKEQSDLNHETLEARLAAALSGGEGGLMDCWNALLELRSCTNEIVLFFLNGEAYLSLDCCRAIRVITRDCWASMLGSLGFTSQEGDVLRGYCDSEGAGAASPPPYSALLPPPGVAPTSPSQGLVL